jgi:hypothetical protein
MEPQVIDYYHELPSSAKVIDKLNEEYHRLEKETSFLKKELEFYKSAFKYPHSNSAVFNLRRVKKDGKDLWIDRIKINENELRELDQCDIVKALIEEIVNFRYRRD